MQAYFLHGNLQTPAVWDFARETFPGQSIAVDLWSGATDSPAAWAKGFCEQIAHDSVADNRRVLVGYSLGGRLAMQALVQDPALWAAVILVGAHPGSDDPELRGAWLKNDTRWAKRFTEEPWGALIAEWDAQTVFGGVPNPCPPCEEDFDRVLLARTFISFSKGNQECMTPALAKLSAPPLLYLSGEYDRIYSRLGVELASRVPGLRHQVVPGAGHRVPWEQPETFLRACREFLADVGVS